MALKSDRKVYKVSIVGRKSSSDSRNGAYSRLGKWIRKTKLIKLYIYIKKKQRTHEK